MILNENLTLNNGVVIPKLGLGTWLIPDGEVAEAVKTAVALGYRHIDTAQAYENERGVGEGVRGCGVPRDQLFITTKVAAEHKTYAEAAAGIDESLKKLDLDYIDLMIIHSPQPWAVYNKSDDRYLEGNREVWRALEDAHLAGKIRAIGLSNFRQGDIENILSAATVKPAVNQILVHIGKTPFDLIDYCKGQDIAVEAYSPIAHGEILNSPEVAAIAEKYGVSVARLCIRYTLQLGLISLPKTANPAHMKDNADVNFVLSDEDMERLKSFKRFKEYGKSGIFPVYSEEK